MNGCEWGRRLNGWERRGGKRCRVGVRFAFSWGGLVFRFQGVRCDLRVTFSQPLFGLFFCRVTFLNIV